LSRGAQASQGAIDRARRAAALPAALALLAVLGGCAAGGLGRHAETDSSVLTGSVNPAGGSADAPQLSDQATIRNAVSAADVKAAGAVPLAWANADTGSRGAISGLVEQRQGERLCRSFTTSRESFDGVALYAGRACMVAPGAWRMEAFDAL
jgi:hypothetical protein